MHASRDRRARSKCSVPTCSCRQTRASNCATMTLPIACSVNRSNNCLRSFGFARAVFTQSEDFEDVRFDSKLILIADGVLYIFDQTAVQVRAAGATATYE